MAHAYSDRFEAFHANKVAYTINEEWANESAGIRRSCTMQGVGQTCTQATQNGWNRMRQQYWSATDRTEYIGTMDDYDVYWKQFPDGYTYESITNTGAAPPGVTWVYMYTFWAIKDQTGWPNNFTTSGTTYHLHKMYVYQSSVNYGTLINLYGDSTPSGSYYTYKYPIFGYYTGADPIFVGSGAAGVATAFINDHTELTDYDSCATDLSPYTRRSCLDVGHATACNLQGTWKLMRNSMMLPTTNASAYSGSVTHKYVVYTNTGGQGYIKFNNVPIPLPWATLANLYIITNRSVWPDTITSGGVTWYIRPFVYVTAPAGTYDLILDGGDRQCDSYTGATYFWAYQDLS